MTYLIQVAIAVRQISFILCIVSFVATCILAVITVVKPARLSMDTAKSSKYLKASIITALVTLLLYVLIPSEETLMYLMIQKRFNDAGIEADADILRQAIDGIGNLIRGK